jgi:hypothetical protein
LDAYGLYDMIFLGVLTYVNTLEKQLPLTSDNLINNLIIQGGLYNGYKGWYRFNPNGSLPESYYAIQKLNNNSYVHVIPEFNIINSIQTISNQI